MRKLKLFSLALMALFSTCLWAATETFDFTEGSTSGLTIAKSGTVANITYSVTNSAYNSIPTLSDGNYFLGMNFSSNSAGILDVTTTASYENIQSISFDCAADNNSNPKVAIYIVDEKEKETVVQAAMVLSSGSTKVWRSKKSGSTIYTLDLSSSPKTGKVHFKFTTGSSGKSGAIDDIVITYNPGAPACPSGLTISGTNAYTEGDEIELTAALSEGNGDISYQWYKGSVAPANAISGATNAKYEVASCTTANAGDYFCVASKTDCDDAVNASAFTITVAADTKCFNMPAIASKPADLPSVTVTGGVLSDVSVNDKSVSMDANGLKFGGNDSRLKVTLADASIVEGTKITVFYKGASSDGSGIGIFDGNCANQTLNTTGLKDNGSVSHTFTAVEAANYADEFIINRNGTGKSICVNAITVEDCGPAVVKHTVTLNYNDGATPAGSLMVVDGNAAVKPADPEYGKYTFLGWFVGDTDTEYNWAAAVTDDITLKAHWQDPWTITFDADGGSEVADITVKHNTKAEKPADPTKDNYDFNGWYIGDTDTPFDWDANVTANYSLKAHWLELVAKYDIEYYDGETKIGTEEQVRVDKHPTAEGINTNKPLYSFVGWYNNADLADEHSVELDEVVPSEGLKLYGKWTKLYASTYDMEAYAASTGASKAGLESALTAANYAYTNINDIDNGHTHNYTYDGMKYKNNDGDLSFNVVAGKVVEVKTGHLPSDDAVTMYINGVADVTVFENADESKETHKINYFYSAVEALYRLEVLASKGTCSIKKVTIRDPYTVSFDANGGEDVASLNGTPSVTLPKPTLEDKYFVGWYDAAEGGNKIGDADDKYTPTANITLYAHWSETEPTALDNTVEETKAIKRIENGQVVIFKDGKYFNVLGIQIR